MHTLISEMTEASSVSLYDGASYLFYVCCWVKYLELLARYSETFSSNTEICQIIKITHSGVAPVVRAND